MAIVLNNVEFDLPESDFTAIATINDCVFESTALDDLPDIFTSSEYSKNNFVYSDYNITVTPLSSSLWTSNDYTTGIGGIASGYERPGVVAFLHTDQRATSFRVWLSVPSPSETNRTFPSLLGTDILRFGRLIVDPAASTVSFDASVGDFDITAG